MGFYDQNDRLIVTVSNPEGGRNGTITLRRLPAGQYAATDLFTNAVIHFAVAGGKGVVPVTVSRWDTRVFAIKKI